MWGAPLCEVDRRGRRERCGHRRHDGDRERRRRAPTGRPGVTATKVNVGAIVSESGPLAADFKPYLSGVNAYFDYVNAMGGVNKRQIDLAYPLDDASNPSTDITDAETLVNSTTPSPSSGSRPLLQRPQVPVHDLDADLRVRDRQRLVGSEELLRRLRLQAQLQLLDPVLRLRRQADQVDERRGHRARLPRLPGRVQGRDRGPQEVQDQGRVLRTSTSRSARTGASRPRRSAARRPTTSSTAWT